MNNYSIPFNSNDVFELLLIGTLYLFKSSLDNSYERQRVQLQQFINTPIYTPSQKPALSSLKNPIIMEGIVDVDKTLSHKTVDYKLKDPFKVKDPLKTSENPTLKLITLYTLRAPIYFRLFDRSSNEYYKEANVKASLSRLNFSTKIDKTHTFILKDYEDNKKFTLIKNNPQDDSLCLDFLSFKKKYEPLNFSRFFRLSEYGHIKKSVGIKCGVYLSVYGDFSYDENGNFMCMSPIKFFRNREQIIDKLKQDMKTPKLLKDIFAIAFYGGLGFWISRKNFEWMRNYADNNN